MKKFLFALMLCVVFMSVPAVSFARSSAGRIGENVLSNVLSTVIIDALRKNGMGDLIPGGESSDTNTEMPAPADGKLPKVSKTQSGVVTELSDEQFQSFSEICLAGSIEEFRKKIEYENISREASYTKNDGTVITLLELAKTSPNPELAEFLQNNGAEAETEE